MSGPLTAEAQRWALELSQIDDPEARQSRLVTAPAPWQPARRRYLAWRLGIAALRDALPGLRAAPVVPPAGKPTDPSSHAGDSHG